MKKPVIAIDIDDVLADETSSALVFFNKRFGLSHTLEDYRADGPYWGYYESIWKVSKVRAAAMYDEYLSSGVRAGHKVMPHAVEVIKALQEHYSLSIITSREEAVLDITHVWLEKHFANVFDHVAFTRAWQGRSDVTKATIALQLGADYLIDDNAEHCNLAADAGLQTLLFGDYGWNRRAPVRESVLRISDWLAIKDYFDAKR